MPGEETLHSIDQERFLKAPLPLVWALLADTNRWDRAVGSKPSRYTYERTVAEDPSTRQRVGRARQMGQEVAWIEQGEWLECQFIWGERQFIDGPFSRVGYRFHVSERDGGTLLSGNMYFTTRDSAQAGLAPAMRAGLTAAVSRYLAAIEELFKRATMPTPSSGPPTSQARLMLLTTSPDQLTMGESTKVNESELAVRARRFESAPVDPQVRERLVELLRTRPDDDVRQMRPFELARAWDTGRREVLRAFLYAARAGLVDLEWQLNCPTCKVGSEAQSSLSSVKRSAHCEDCNIDYELDFAENIEAVFHVNRALRDIEPRVYCAGSPSFRPHVFGLLSALPNASRETTATLPAGLLLVRALKAQRRGAIAIGEGIPKELEVRITAGEVLLSTVPRAPGDKGTSTLLRVTNETADPVILSLERSGWNADIVLGSVILTLPEFLDLFSTEAPAAGVELTVGSLTVLFSDLTGTTAMYERVGDARAFAIIEEHFRAVTEAVARNEGAVVKTMGDAVMATFHTPARALAAAFELVTRVRTTAQAHGVEGLAIKIGLHEGPCLAVRANDRLDFFGTTVNVAARMQGQARGNDVVISAGLLEHPEVERLLSSSGFSVEQFRTELKGLRGAQHLLRIAALPS